jgi:SAM-dependent methyltransferase
MGALPLEDESFDLILSNGVLCHLPFFDNLIKESYRLLRKGGHIAYTLPNMANYIQRLTLLLGYQPNDALISDTIRTGTIFYNKRYSDKHIHGATPRAIRELLEYYKFKNIRIFRGDPSLRGTFHRWNWLFKTIGFICPASLSRRLIVLAEK